MNTTNLDQLTEKIYREAIQKAEAEAEEILRNAKVKADQIIQNAQEEAEVNILNKAKKEAELLKASTESELKIKGNRLISDLKREIRDLISDTILKKNIKELFHDPSFFKELILEIVKHWSKEDVMELRLPSSIEGKLDNGFDQEIAACLKDLKITYDDRIKGGFRVSRVDDSYQISFTDDDFVAFFQTYLDPKTQKLLFGEEK